MNPKQIVLIDDDARNADMFFEQIGKSLFSTSQCRWIHIAAKQPNSDLLPTGGNFEYLWVNSMEKLCNAIVPLSDDAIVFYDLNLAHLQKNHEDALGSRITAQLISYAANRNILIVVHSGDSFRARVSNFMKDKGVFAIASSSPISGANAEEISGIIVKVSEAWEKNQAEKDRSKYSIEDYFAEIDNLTVDCHEEKENPELLHTQCFEAMARLLRFDPEELKKKINYTSYKPTIEKVVELSLSSNAKACNIKLLYSTFIAWAAFRCDFSNKTAIDDYFATSIKDYCENLSKLSFESYMDNLKRSCTAPYYTNKIKKESNKGYLYFTEIVKAQYTIFRRLFTHDNTHERPPNPLYTTTLLTRVTLNTRGLPLEININPDALFSTIKSFFDVLTSNIKDMTNISLPQEDHKTSRAILFYWLLSNIADKTNDNEMWFGNTFPLNIKRLSSTKMSVELTGGFENE